MRRQAIVIGLGQFGLALARSLAASDVEVLGVDADQDRVQVAAEHLAEAVCCDAMDEDALARTDPASRDLCVCAIGDEGREAAIIVTTLLRQLGAKRVIARAGDGLLERILRLVGAHEVVNPDRAYGERLARRLLYQGILEEISLAEDLVMSEVRVPPAFVGHTLAELELPKRYELTVLGLRRRDDEGRTRIARPEGDTRLLEGDIALVVAPPGASQELMERLGE